ncbi:hypothetical protein CPB84DRAFT_1770349 [Gymnopilus junonius]|uniref:Transcription activator of gluconeogenesis ERT1 n=1 Tax=Gymnopilus junonius TaxID=109634 RepID=A0A9P5NV13_GYMJU|nr:hypothetical protein CPB84DRAFT_1770349 [Gymnopilus junonius]
MSSPPVPISDNISSVWPRRASKACAGCRRDKTRCDGARPCGGCIKKGYTADQCTDGCESCRRARLRCEDGRPCRRCLEMEIDCAEESNVLGQRPLTPPLTSRAARGDRAKLACSSCRRDNKKCDDQRPCSRCIARGDECIHIARGPKLVKLRCEGCRIDNKRCEDSRPCKYCIDSSKQCVIVPRKGRGHGTRVKAACMSCRRDKIRCNGDRPCTSCVKKGCECIERACNTCSREGKAAECPHRNGQDSGTSASTGSLVNIKGNEYRFQQSFQPDPSMELSRDNLNTRHVPAYASGLQPHAAQSMYPNVMSFEHQYYFPPQSSGHASFPVVHNPAFSANDSAQLGYGYGEHNVRHTDSNMNHPQTIHSHHGTFPQAN